MSEYVGIYLYGWLVCWIALIEDTTLEEMFLSAIAATVWRVMLPARILRNIIQ